MPITVENLRKARQYEYAIDSFLKAINYRGKVLAMNAKLAETSYRYFLPFVDNWMKFTIDEINDAFAKKYINKSLSFEKDEFAGIPKIDPSKLDMAIPYSDKIVNQYMEDIKAGKKIIPIFVDEKNPKHIVDGLHRASAYQRLGMEVPYIAVNRVDALTSLAKPKMTPELYFNQIVNAKKDEAINITTNLLDWRDLDNTGAKMLKPATLEIMANSGNLANKIAGVEGTFDIINPKTVEVVNKICSEAIKQVEDETKKAINEIIRQGLLEGKSMGRVVREIKPLVGLTSRQAAAVGKYEAMLGIKKPDLSVEKINKLVDEYTNKLHNYRTEMIARTESMRAVNEGQRLAYSEEGYKTLIWSANAGACPQCAAENGHEYGIEEAEGMIPAHPDCRCTWLTGSKKEKMPQEKPTEEIPRREHLEGSIPKDKAISQFIEDAKINGKIFTYNEAEEVYNSVKAYSGGLYKNIRSYQMNPEKFISLNKPKIVKDVKKIAGNLDEFFKYSKKYEEKMIYRGIDLTKKEVTLFKKGQIIDMGGASSFSSDPLTAARFGNVQFRLKNKTGVSIKHISFSSSENEIILPKNLKFKITKIKEISKEIYDIHIEEVL